jgi:hypothetical protein
MANTRQSAAATASTIRIRTAPADGGTSSADRVIATPIFGASEINQLATWWVHPLGAAHSSVEGCSSRRASRFTPSGRSRSRAWCWTRAGSKELQFNSTEPQPESEVTRDGKVVFTYDNPRARRPAAGLDRVPGQPAERRLAIVRRRAR